MWLLVLSSLESAIFVGCGGGEGGKYKPKLSSSLSGARGSSCSGSASTYSSLGLGLGDGDSGGTTSRAGGIWRRIGNMGLSAGEWAGLASADSAEEEGAVGVRYGSAMVGNNSGTATQGLMCLLVYEVL